MEQNKELRFLVDNLLRLYEKTGKLVAKEVTAGTKYYNENLGLGNPMEILDSFRRDGVEDWEDSLWDEVKFWHRFNLEDSEKSYAEFLDLLTDKDLVKMSEEIVYDMTTFKESALEELNYSIERDKERNSA